MLTGGKGAATASGAISRRKAATGRLRGDVEFLQRPAHRPHGPDGGKRGGCGNHPPVEAKPDRVPVKDEDKKGVVDPVSALLMPASRPESLIDPANCNRTIPIFDGAARFDVVLATTRPRMSTSLGITGPVLVCNARYVPISGHRALRPATKFMEENKDMSVWLAPVEGQRVLVPAQGLGAHDGRHSEMQASAWSLEGDGKVGADPQGRQGRRGDPGRSRSVDPGKRLVDSCRSGSGSGRSHHITG